MDRYSQTYTQTCTDNHPDLISRTIDLCSCTRVQQDVTQTDTDMHTQIKTLTHTQTQPHNHSQKNTHTDLTFPGLLIAARVHGFNRTQKDIHTNTHKHTQTQTLTHNHSHKHIHTHTQNHSQKHTHTDLTFPGLLIAARVHGFNRTQKDILRAVRVCDSTLRRRFA